MNTWLRLARSAVLCCLMSFAALKLPAQGARYVLLALVGSIFLWAVVRAFYLRRFRVLVDATQVTVTQGKDTLLCVAYSEVRQAMFAHPSFALFVQHLWHRALQSPVGPRHIIPAGLRWPEVARRLWTLSSDTIIHDASGTVVIVPMGALDMKQRLELRAHLAQLPASVTQPDEAHITAAFRYTEEATSYEQGRQWERALEAYGRAANAWARVHIQDMRASCLRNMVTSLNMLGRYSEALGLGAEALQLTLTPGVDNDQTGEAFLRNELGRALLASGGLQEMKSAIEHIERAAEIHERKREPFFQCRMVANKAVALEEVFLQTKVAAREAESQEQRNVLLLEAEKCLNDSEVAAQQALDILHAAFRGSRDPEVLAQEARAAGAKARCAYHHKHWAEAAALFEETINAAGGNAVLTDMAMWGRALFHYSHEGSLSEAERRSSLAEGLQKIDVALRGASMLGAFSESMELYTLRGDTFWDIGNYSAAARDYEVALDLLERRPFLFTQPLDRIALLRRYRHVYPRVVEAHLRAALAQRDRGRDLLARAFYYSERAKAANLLELITLSGEFLSRLSAHQRERLSEAERDLRERYSYMQQLRESAADRVEMDTAWKALWAAEEKLRERQRHALEAYPELATTRKIAPLDEVRAALPRDNKSAVLQFTVGENSLCVFLIAPHADPLETCFLIEGLGDRDLAEVFKDFIRTYNEFTRASANCEQAQAHAAADQQGARAQFEQLARQAAFVYEQAKRPWLSRLREVPALARKRILEARGSEGLSAVHLLRQLGLTRVVLVTEGLLHRIPLHAALDEGVAASYSPSSSILLHTVRQAVAAPQSILIVAAADSSLPEAQVEAAAIATRCTAAGMAVRVLSGKQANSDIILADMGRYSWVHSCGHARSSLLSPWESCIELTSEVEDEGRVLTAGEVMRKAQVSGGAGIVANGCSTGVARPDPSGEFAGLPAAFLSAGFSVVISTLWEVPAGTPVILADRFYENLCQRGLPYAEALAEAASFLRHLTPAEIERYRLALVHRIEAQGHDLAGGLTTESELTQRLLDETTEPQPSHPWHWAGFVIWGAPWLSADSPAVVAETVPSPVPIVSPTLVGASPAMIEAVQRAGNIMQQERPSAALPLLQDMLHKWGSNLIVHDYLAAAHSDLGEHVKECDHQLEALKFDPNSFNRHYNLGCAYMSLGQVADARACFGRAVELNPVCAEAFFNLALVTNDPALVAQYLRQGTLINPHDRDMQESLAVWQQLIAEPHFSMAEYRIAMAMKAQSAREYNVARRELAMACEEALHGELQQAACVCQAEIARAEQDLRASVAALEQAVQFGPVEPFVWNNIAARLLLLVQQADFPLAERAAALHRVDETARQASALSDYSRPHQNRALSLFLLGQLPEATHQAAIAEDMAQRQIATGPTGGRVCLGCPTDAQMPEECQGCLRKARGLAQDIALAEGNYHL